MKKNLLKILSISIVVCFVVIFLVNWFNIEPKQDEKGFLYYKSYFGTAYSINQGTCTDAEVEIPSKFKGLPVVEISNNGFRSVDNLLSVKIPKSISVIHVQAFYDCIN